MFIKKAAAEARLKDPSNILRRKDSCETTEEDERRAEEALHGVKDNQRSESNPITLDRKDEEVVDEPEVVDELPILKELDGLLNPDAHRLTHPYMKRRDAQVAIGETAIILGEKAAGGIFGLGPDQALAYSEGKTGWGHSKGHGEVIPEVWQRIQKSKQQIAEKAAKRLEATLDSITPDKLNKVKKVDKLARVGKDMAIILEKVSPKEGPNEGGVHFHIFRPEFKQENHYETVTLASSVPDQK